MPRRRGRRASRSQRDRVSDYIGGVLQAGETYTYTYKSVPLAGKGNRAFRPLRAEIQVAPCSNTQSPGDLTSICWQAEWYQSGAVSTSVPAGVCSTGPIICGRGQMSHRVLAYPSGAASFMAGMPSNLAVFRIAALAQRVSDPVGFRYVVRLHFALWPEDFDPSVKLDLAPDPPTPPSSAGSSVPALAIGWR